MDFRWYDDQGCQDQHQPCTSTRQTSTTSIKCQDIFNTLCLRSGYHRQYVLYLSLVRLYYEYIPSPKLYLNDRLIIDENTGNTVRSLMMAKPRQLVHQDITHNRNPTTVQNCYFVSSKPDTSSDLYFVKQCPQCTQVSADISVGFGLYPTLHDVGTQSK